MSLMSLKKLKYQKQTQNKLKVISNWKYTLVYTFDDIASRFFFYLFICIKWQKNLSEILVSVDHIIINEEKLRRERDNERMRDEYWISDKSLIIKW